jgi:hypothetical protein
MSNQIAQQSFLNKSRKDKFLLVLNLPDALKKINKLNSSERATNNVILDTLQYSVYGTVVPQTAILPTALPFGGQTLNVTTGKREKYDEVTVKFTVDNGFNNWWVLWQWLNFINDAQSSVQDSGNLVPFATDANGNMVYTSTTNLQPYQTIVTVYGLDEYNNKKIRWTYNKAFITKLNGIDYSYRDAEQMESSFTFTFSQLKAELL